MPSAHSNQIAIQVAKATTSMTVADTSTYGADNHAVAAFTKYLIEITNPDSSVQRAASYDFGLGSYSTISSPSAEDPNQLSVGFDYTTLGYYTVNVYSVPVTGGLGNEYGLGDCFFRVADNKIYKVVAAGGVDITVDTDFTDATKYQEITIKTVTSRYAASTTVFAFTQDIRRCFQSKLTKAKCAIESQITCDDCNNPELISGYDVAMMQDLFEYLDGTNESLDIQSTIDYARNICADDCCEIPLVTVTMGGTECAVCTDEEEDDDECCDSLQGLRYRTDATAIQVSGAPKKRAFSQLVGVLEDDIISVSVGDAEYSFGTEIVSFESSTGTLEFSGTLPSNSVFPVWIRIQWMQRS